MAKQNKPRNVPQAIEGALRANLLDQMGPFTATPNWHYDYMPQLSHSEWKVLCVVVRKTLGFKDDNRPGKQKEADQISYSQFIEMTGLSKNTVIATLEQLQAYHFIDTPVNWKPGKKGMKYIIVLDKNRIDMANVLIKDKPAKRATVPTIGTVDAKVNKVVDIASVPTDGIANVVSVPTVDTPLYQPVVHDHTNQWYHNRNIENTAATTRDSAGGGAAAVTIENTTVPAKNETDTTHPSVSALDAPTLVNYVELIGGWDTYNRTQLVDAFKACDLDIITYHCDVQCWKHPQDVARALKGVGILNQAQLDKCIAELDYDFPQQPTPVQDTPARIPPRVGTATPPQAQDKDAIEAAALVRKCDHIALDAFTKLNQKFGMDDEVALQSLRDRKFITTAEYQAASSYIAELSYLPF